MTLNPPYKVRAVLYVLTMIGTPVMAYLLSKGYVGTLEMALWSGEVSVVSALAAFNTSSATDGKAN